MAGGGARPAGGRRHLVSMLVVLLGCSGVVACDGRAPPTPPREEVPWPPGPWEPARRPYDTSPKERATVEVPWAGHPGLDLEPPRPVRRLIVNVEREGTLYFKGERWSLDHERRARAFHEPLHRCPDARDARRERESAARTPPSRLPPALGGRARGRGGATRASRRNRRPALGCRVPRARRVGEVAHRASRPPPTRSRRRQRWGLTLGWTQGPDDASAVPVLRIGDDHFAFAAGDPYAAGAANDLANRNWRAIAARLERAKAGGGRAAVLTIDDRVPWAYVAMTVGTLLDVGIDRVHLAESGYRVSTPAARSLPWHAGDRDPRDWHPALALGVGACIALAVFGLGAFSGRRRGRGLPRSRAAGAPGGAARS